MKDLTVEISEAFERAAGADFFDVMDALLAGRVRLGAVNASGGIGWAAAGTLAEDVVLSLVADGYGLVASVDGGEWVSVRELQSAEVRTAVTP